MSSTRESWIREFQISTGSEINEWIVDIGVTLRHINNEGIKTGSICRVPEKIREANKEKSEEWYRPKFVAMGPIHRGATIDLQTMELTKWRYMDRLLQRTPSYLLYSTFSSSSNEMTSTECIIRASYGDAIDMGTEEFSRIMFLDACFLLELLLSLFNTRRLSDNRPFDLGHIDDDKKMSRLLTDLMLLENQVPFLLLTILSSSLMHYYGGLPIITSLAALCQDDKLSPQKLAEFLFGCDVAGAGLTKHVCHFLHLIHLCSPDPYQHQDNHRRDPLQLNRCARKLQAFGITIKTSQTNESRGTVAPGLREFMDQFEFKIEFHETERELIIPTLHIKEVTEFKWRNFIAWEQIGRLIGVGYKFTSYAYFFTGLVCSVHDVQLLREAEVIQVQTGAKDEDLLIMFQSIATGAELMDGRYTDLCEKLNKAKVKGVAGWCVLILRMKWHYYRCFLEWVQSASVRMLLSFIDIYLGTPWKFIGVVSGGVLLVLTFMQTFYTVRSSR